MILPTKHIRFSESILGLAGYLLNHIKTNTSCSIDELWEYCQQSTTSSRCFVNQSFDNIIKAVDLLYMMGIVELDEEGKVQKS